MLNNVALYRSQQGFSAMMRTYNAQLARWPAPYREIVVPTRYGETHLLASGAEDAPPLVLLHGLAANALVWRPNVKFLSAHFRVYALDNIGDAGKSAPTRPSLQGAAYAEWLVDVFDGLQIARANVVGISLGGWIALKTAIHAAHRVARVMPICPAGFVPPRLAFVPTALFASLFPTEVTIDWVARALCSPSNSLDAEDSELLSLSLRHHRSKMIPLVPFSDDDLACVTAETFILVGEHEVMFSPRAVVGRAQAIPGARAEIIPDAGHALNSDQPALLHERILRFFAGPRARDATLS